MNTNSKIGPFRPPKESQMINARDVQHWIAEQARHDAEKDDPDHHCYFCPVRVVIPASEINRVEQ